jgi:S-adenosylmethionine:tRNA ribosyltransferase-isomerase
VNVSDFDFDLPEDLIAQHPPVARGQSRLLVIQRKTGAVEHTAFERLPDHLREGDLLVLNDTRVFPARLLGRRVPSGGAVECLLIRQLPTPNSQLLKPKAQSPEPGPARPGSTQLPTPNPKAQSPEPEPTSNGVEWEALMHPGQKLKPGAEVVFERDGHRLRGEVLARHFHGLRTIRLWADEGEDVGAAIEHVGHVPLPPYIKRPDQQSDRDRYQTVYARAPGSVAAPTAGLHFTLPLLDRLAAKGVERTTITLHVGYGTFKPVRVDQVEAHEVDPERYVVAPPAADALTRALREGRRIIAVGTTTTRALESLTVDEDTIAPAAGDTRLFIHPGHRFRLVTGLVTNFHLPKSSLLMLVAAFADRDTILAAYRGAVAQQYRFYSYGDAMLVL